MKTEFTAHDSEKDPGLYIYRHQSKQGRWSTKYYAVLKTWQGDSMRKPLTRDLKSSRLQLNNLIKLNNAEHDFRAEVEKKKSEQQQKTADEMTVSKWCDLCAKRPQVTIKQSADRDGNLYFHLRRILGEKSLNGLTVDDLFSYIAARRKEITLRCNPAKTNHYGKTRKCRCKAKVKDGTIRNELASLRSILNIAIEDGVQCSVISFDKALAQVHADERKRILLPSEEARLFDCFAGKYDERETIEWEWLRRVVVVLLETALSRGDLLRLTWPMIENEAGVIRLEKGRKKTKVEQTPPLTDTVREVLDLIRADRKAGKIVANKDGLVFTTAQGRPLTGDMIHTALKRACRKAGIANFTVHDLRKTAITRWAKAGTPVEIAMKASGHSSVQMHNYYSNISRTDVAEFFKTGLKRENDVQKKVENA